LPVRRSNASCGLLQTNLYTPRHLAELVPFPPRESVNWGRKKS
jgi:hypothetical protein